MFHLVYVSSAVAPFSQDELLDLMARSRENNARVGLTGLLLYKDGNFMQVLEGDEGAVRATYARIGQDRRHRGLLTLLQGPIDERSFPDWTMGLRELNSPEVLSSPGFSPFLNSPLTDREFSTDPSRCQKLLLTFKKSM